MLATIWSAVNLPKFRPRYNTWTGKRESGDSMEKALHVLFSVFLICVYFTFSVLFQLFFIDPISATILSDILVCIIGGIYIKTYFGRNIIKHVSSVYIGCIFGLLVLVWLFSQITAAWFLQNVGDVMYDERQAVVNTNFSAYLFLTIFLAPVAEEILYRGVVFNVLSNCIPVWLAYCVSSLFFAFMHGTIVHMFIGFACGILFAVAYQYTGKLWLSILLHMVYNTLSVFSFLFHIPKIMFYPSVFGTIDLLLIIILTLECCRVQDAQGIRGVRNIRYLEPSMTTKIKCTMPAIQKNNDGTVYHGNSQEESERIRKAAVMITETEHDMFASNELQPEHGCEICNSMCHHVDDGLGVTCENYFIGKCFSKTGRCCQK